MEKGNEICKRGAGFQASFTKMKAVMQWVLWTNVGLILYVYIGYPALLWLLNKLKGEWLVGFGESYEPRISLIVAAHNEERVIAQKLENTLELEYPRDKLEILIVSDGSADMTAEIVRRYTGRGVHLLELLQNYGKATAQNSAVEHATGEILLFTDADVLLSPESLHQMIAHLSYDDVGCVVGRVVYSNERETVVTKGENAYWRYELALREQESRLGILAMGSGALIALRRSLFAPMDPGVSEDFVLPMNVAMKGYKTVYASEVGARTELSQDRPGEMFRTKVRTITMDVRGVLICRAILNPLRYPFYAWGLTSHKLLRWMVPYFLIGILGINLMLMKYPVYRLIMGLQAAFYTLALAGYFWQKKGGAPKIAGIPFSFCLINLAALVGVGGFVMGKKAGRWQPVR